MTTSTATLIWSWRPIFVALLMALVAHLALMTFPLHAQVMHGEPQIAIAQNVACSSCAALAGADQMEMGSCPAMTVAPITQHPSPAAARAS